MACKQNSSSHSPSPSPVTTKIDSSSEGKATSTFPSHEEREKFQQFIHLIEKLHRDAYECKRVQRGSPAAHSLTSAIVSVKGQLKEVEVESIITDYANLFFMTRLNEQHKSFYEVLNEDINEIGFEEGYSFRVNYLEELNFKAGILKGMMETVLEYWKFVDKDVDKDKKQEVCKELTYEQGDSTTPLPCKEEASV